MRVKQTALYFLQKWIDLVQDHSKLVILVMLTLAGLSLIYTKDNLGMNTDTRDMLSKDLDWRQRDLEYDREFPQFTDNITVVIEAPTPDQASDAAMVMYKALLKENKLFKSVYYNRALPIFRKSALLFLDKEDLQDLSDNLAEIQPFLSRLTDDQTLRGLYSMLDEIMDAIKDDNTKVDVSPLLSQMNLAMIAARKNLPYRVSWQRLMNGTKSDGAVSREFIILQPRLDYSSLMPAKAAIDRLHALARELNIEKDIGAKVKLTGTATLEYEELVSVTRGTEIAMVLSLIAVTIILLVGLRSVRLMLVTLITLITGLLFTAAFAAFAVHELNLISIAFAVLYIGLGVDYAVHYCLRYRELCLHGYSDRDAIEKSSLHIGSSMFLCAVTTAIGFFAFIPTAYNGVAELGLISGAGILISLVVTLTLLPALLRLLHFKFPIKADPEIHKKVPSKILLFPFTHARKIRISALVITLLSLVLLTHVKFDHNTLNLQDPENESVKTFKDLLADSNISPWSSEVLAKGRQDALNVVKKVGALSLVENTVWVEDFIPTDQDDKLALIEEMDLLLGDLPATAKKPDITDAERVNALRSFVSRVNAMGPAILGPSFTRLRDSTTRFLDYLATLDESKQSAALLKLENSMLVSLPGRLDTLRESLKADYVTYDDLPKQLVERWHNDKDIYRIEIFPRENIYDNGALRRFVNQVEKVEPRVTGTPIINIKASDAVVEAFQQAFLYAFIVIVSFLLILLERKKDTIYIMLPMIMAAVCTCASTVLLDIPFNFANVIALPLILGIGVDSGIHILHRFRTAMPTDRNLLGTSSARAVVISALTTICSIGNLAFSPHMGMASMGKLLTISIGITLICMLIVLPSLLARHIHEQ